MSGYDFERRPPYIGVSGVAGPAVETELQMFGGRIGMNDMPMPSYRRLLLGVKATHKTQMLDTANKYGNVWYPVGASNFHTALRNKNARWFFVDEPRADSFGVAQIYAEPELVVSDPSYLYEFTERLVTRGGSWLQGLQFDMLPWDKHDLTEYFAWLRETHPRYMVILQCYKQVMEQGADSAIEKIGRYGSMIDYVLFDASHGTGQRLDVEALREFVAAGYDSTDLKPVNFGVAGGLDAETVPQLEPLVDEFPELSWDAEGRLRGEKHVSRFGGNVIWPLDLDKTKRYLAASTHLLGNRP